MRLNVSGWYASLKNGDLWVYECYRLSLTHFICVRFGGSSPRRLLRGCLKCWRAREETYSGRGTDFCEFSVVLFVDRQVQHVFTDSHTNRSLHSPTLQNAPALGCCWGLLGPTPTSWLWFRGSRTWTARKIMEQVIEIMDWYYIRCFFCTITLAYNVYNIYAKCHPIMTSCYHQCSFQNYTKSSFFMQHKMG